MQTAPIVPILFTGQRFHPPAEVVKDIGPKDISGTRVVFINMPLRETAMPNTTPQGPLLLATNLRQNYGVNATIIDLNAYRHGLGERKSLLNGRHLTEEEARAMIKRHFEIHGEPNLVAFSGIITTLRWQETVARMVREFAPDTFLVSGNGLATELKTGLFNYIPELDAVAHSEGDEVIVKIVHDAKTIKEMDMKSAIASGKLEPYHVGEINGRERFIYDGNRPADLNRIPFADLDLLEHDVFGNPIRDWYLEVPVWGTAANNSSATSFSMSRSTTFVSSRGCPHACSFCYRGAQGERKYGTRSAKNIADEFKLHIDRYGVDFIGMPDDNFGVDYDRIVDLEKIFRAEGIKMRWGTHTRLDEAAGLRPNSNTFEDPLRIKLMADAGSIYIGFGAESASKRVLTAMHKGGFILGNGYVPMRVNGREWNFPRTMIEGITKCEEVGIHANCTWIMAYPTETVDDLKTSVAFIQWQENFYASRGKSTDSVNKRMFTATCYPGTAMADHPKVRRTLADVFGISFDPMNQPVCDENFHQYVLELDDATKLLHNPKTREPLNYSDMPMETFLKARELVDEGRTFEILDM